MGRKLHYRPGSFYRADDRTGFPQRAERTRREWTGLFVDENVWEARQPQDLVKGVKDKQSVPNARPLAPNIDVGPYYVQLTENEAIGAIVLEVNSTATFRPGCTVQIILDSGETFTTIVESVGAGEITILGGLPYSASSGNLVANLSAAIDSPVFAVLAEDALEGDIVLEVVSAAGFRVGDAIDVLLDDGSLFGTTIVLITGNLITIGNAMIGLASAGRTVSRRRGQGGGVGPNPPPPPQIPVNTVLPEITGATAVGETLTMSDGSWTRSPNSFAKVWLRGASVIPGATDDTYELTEDDAGFLIAGRVIASNAAGPSAPASAAPVGPVTAAAGIPVNVDLPEIDGVPQVGETLTVTDGTWTNAPSSYARQWLLNGSAISGETGSSYLVMLGDEGNEVSAQVIASNAAGPSAPAVSTAVVPSPSGVPASVNAPVVGTDLTAVWNLQYSGTGPRFAQTNGFFNEPIVAGAPVANAYLQSLGATFCIFDNIGQGILFVCADGSTITIEKFDFSTGAAPVVAFYGDDLTFIFKDCKFGAGGIVTGRDINLNPVNAQSQSLLVEYCDRDVGTITLFAITPAFEERYCRIRRQPNIIWFTGFQHVNQTHLNIHHNYITGGYCESAPGAHCEVLQDIPDAAAEAAGCTLSFTQNMVSLLVDGQAAPTTVWGVGWTGWFSEGGVTMTVTDNIVEGFLEANTLNGNPGRMGPFLGMAQTTIATFTNNALSLAGTGIGANFYFNHSPGGTTTPILAGGNRDFDSNTPLTL